MLPLVKWTAKIVFLKFNPNSSMEVLFKTHTIEKSAFVNDG
jgi:hypothetical protein